MKKVFKGIWKGIKVFAVVRIVFGFLNQYFEVFNLLLEKLRETNSFEESVYYLKENTTDVYTGTWKGFRKAWDQSVRYIKGIDEKEKQMKKEREERKQRDALLEDSEILCK
jgi:hypothetical protein